MATRQVVEIDLTFADSYSKLTASDFMKMLEGKTIKNISIKVTNKRKEA